MAIELIMQQNRSIASLLTPRMAGTWLVA